MSSIEASLPPDNSIGETACGGIIRIAADTPYVIYKDEIVYLCGQGCKQLYEEEPLCSCLAARILSDK